MHLYAFGSICRGEIDEFSDFDVLAIVDGFDPRFDRHTYSIYSYKKIRLLWRLGNPFAWHLFLESRILHSSDGKDFLKILGKPSPYLQGLSDCRKFMTVFNDAYTELKLSPEIPIFQLSSMFLGYRNFATCYSLHVGDDPTFSRQAAFQISHPVPISRAVNYVFERCRILSTRAVGELPSNSDIKNALGAAPEILAWMEELTEGMQDG